MCWISATYKAKERTLKEGFLQVLFSESKNGELQVSKEVREENLKNWQILKGCWDKHDKAQILTQQNQG